MLRNSLLVLLIVALAGCATPGYDQYAAAVARQAEYQADVQREQAKAIMALAQSGDATTKTVAVMLLAMQQGQNRAPAIEPPRDPALQWAAVIMPSVTALAGGYFGYKLGQTQSNNQAATTTASYNAFGSIATAGFGSNAAIAGAGFGAIPAPVSIDWAGIIAGVKPNNTTTVSIGGDGTVGGGTVSKPVTTTTTTTTNTTDRHDITYPTTLVPAAP